MARPRNPYRDDEIVLAVAAGKSATEIARDYGLSRSTMSRLIGKLRDIGRISVVAAEGQEEEAPQQFETRYAEWIPIPVCAREVAPPQQIYGPRPRYHYHGGFSIFSRGVL